MSVALRPADDADEWLFYVLRNDPVATQMSQRSYINPEEHARWWRATNDYRFVAEAEGHTVGTMRLSLAGTVSIIVAPDSRGKGIGPLMLLALEEHARSLGIPDLRADIAYENLPSQRAFAKAEWRPTQYEKHL